MIGTQGHYGSGHSGFAYGDRKVYMDKAMMFDSRSFFAVLAIHGSGSLDRLSARLSLLPWISDWDFQLWCLFISHRV